LTDEGNDTLTRTAPRLADAAAGNAALAPAPTATSANVKTTRPTTWPSSAPEARSGARTTRINQASRLIGQH
jgi:hypothetical protein